MRFAGTVARSTLAASQPIASQASSAKTHATAAQGHHAKKPRARITPARIPTAALTAHSLGEPGHRPAIPTPAANALRIHNAGNFTELAA
jgi:hypothetical protein